jgi:MFS transporter, PAT family, beta-lactamase induction signal transducer AmpG
MDNLFNGMGTAALLAFLMSLCDQRYTATQYALLSAIASVPRVFIGPIAGVMVEHLGWPEFFAWSLIVCIPGLVALWWIRHQIGELNLQTAY